MSEVNVSAPDAAATSTPSAAPSTPAAATSAVSASPVATPQASQNTATSVSAEDRTNWVPPHRIRETREATLRQAQEQYTSQLSQMKTEMDRYRQQVLALTGVTPPPNPEINAVKDQFGRIYPGLAKMEDRADAIDELLQRSKDLEAQSEHYWQQHGQRTLDSLFKKASESLGGPVNENAKRYLHSSFVGWVQSSPELQNRYTSDPTLVDEFWNLVSSNLIDPVRRSTSATVAGRANASLPQDTPSGSVRASGGSPTQFKSLDERAAAAWTMINQDRNKV